MNTSTLGDRTKKGRRPSDDSARTQESPAVDENIHAIRRWEQEALHSRSTAERLSDRITTVAGSGPVQLAHVAWFAFWISVNTGLVSSVRPFDPFPFPLLTTVVSLEAIFLALFVLASQNRLSHQSDKRAHLDLQVDLLAEREMTAVLQLLQDIANHLGVKGTLTRDQIRDLTKKTDIHKLTDKLGDVPAVAKRGPRPPSPDVRDRSKA
jgi:uncharacterized membrane protein